MVDARINLPTPTPPVLYLTSVIAPFAPLYDNKNLIAGLQTELLHGQRFKVYAEGGDWLWGQASSLIEGSRRLAYIGYVRKDAMSQVEFTATHCVTALRAPVFSQADIKSPIRYALPLNAQISETADRQNKQTDFVQTTAGGYVHTFHLRALVDLPQETDFVSVAERHIGTPYVWGGTGMMGLDCSGLVQMALCAVGIDVPRDADMQEADLGNLAEGPLKRGDLIFWPGHVGIMSDGETLLHANAFHMSTEKEPYEKAKTRIGNPRSIKRL